MPKLPGIRNVQMKEQEKKDFQKRSIVSVFRNPNSEFKIAFQVKVRVPSSD
jgi:hypothetical protein